jgi:hypothetical protein
MLGAAGRAEQENCISITAAEKLWAREISGTFKGPEVLQRSA